MWIIRVTFLFLGVVALLWLLLNNAAYRTDFSLFGKDFSLISTNYIMILSFLGGMFFWFLIALVNELNLRGQIRKLRRQADRLNKELVELRNLPLEETAAEPAGKEETFTAAGASP